MYRSQFVTGISNGGLIAYPDGGRHDPQDLKRVWHSVARFG